jgi:Tfp pilus assembly protein PilO
MKLGRLTKEKRTQLILVTLVVVGLMIGLGFGLIQSQYSKLGGLADRKATATQKLAQMQDAVKNSKRLEADLVESKKKLVELESDAASGDLYSWMINTIRRFKQAHKVEIPQFGQLGAVSDVSLLPDFPYKQVSLTVAGSAHFHDFGRFLADFENQFPHVRVLNLTLDVDAAPQDQEMLAFKMEIITLVKPTQS